MLDVATYWSFNSTILDLLWDLGGGQINLNENKYLVCHCISWLISTVWGRLVNHLSVCQGNSIWQSHAYSIPSLSLGCSKKSQSPCSFAIVSWLNASHFYSDKSTALLKCKCASQDKYLLWLLQPLWNRNSGPTL